MLVQGTFIDIDTFLVLTCEAMLAFWIARRLTLAGKATDGIYANCSASTRVLLIAFVHVCASDTSVGIGLISDIARAIIVDQIVGALRILAADARVEFAHQPRIIIKSIFYVDLDTYAKINQSE